MLTTSKKLLKKYRACTDRYKYLCKALGDGYADNTEIPLWRILVINGIDDATWALRAVAASQAKERDTLARLFAADCAEHVLPVYAQKHPDDERPWDMIVAARRLALGLINEAEAAAAANLFAAANAAVYAATVLYATVYTTYAAAASATHAAGAYADDAGVYAEREWQRKRLERYLRGEVDYEAIKAALPPMEED